MNRKNLFFVSLVLSVVSFVSCKPRYDVTMEKLLQEIMSSETVSEWPRIEYKAAQISSYDRRTISKDQPGWWANHDGFGYERMENISGRDEKVLFDEDGPGAIVRIWMTTQNKTGVLRFYIDGDPEPAVTIDAYDMDRFPIDCGRALSHTHTHYVEELSGVGGNTFFLPVPYAKSCKVTLEEVPGTAYPHYYHIGYRKYASDVAVRSFTISEAKSLSAQITEVNETLMAPSVPASCKSVSMYVGNETVTRKLMLPDGPHAVRSVEFCLTSAEDMTDAMKNTSIVMSFDGKECVRCPLDCFFMAGTGMPWVSGWYCDSDGKGNARARWLMPYRHTAEIWVESTSDTPFNGEITVYTGKHEWKDNSLYFHAASRSEDGIPVNNRYDSDDNLDWNFADLKGRGILVGDILTLYNHCPDWYGEGDEKIYVDGEDFPSFMGTGTEDYYNCSWAPVVPFSTPFGGAPRADETSSHGYNTFSRTRNLDVIPFGKSLDFDLEMLSWNPGKVDYRVAIFAYGDADLEIY